MPLFFLIAIGAGAMTVGATTVDVTTDARHQERAAAHAQASGFQANAYVTHEDCVKAAIQRGLSAAACSQS